MPELLLVRHDTREPALDGAVAGLLAARLGARLRRLRGGRDHATDHTGLDVRQHVLADGGLGANGLLWAERASGRGVDSAVEIDGADDLPEDRTVVVAVNPAIAGTEAPAALAAAAASRGWTVRTAHVQADRGELAALAGEDGQECLIGRWWRDRFGRLDGGTEPTAGAPALRILVLGIESHHRQVYPAVMAALGDAADTVGHRVAVGFVAPDEPALIAEALADADGLVLPGGSDMGQVAGQIAAARHTLRHGLPTVGLCLGMQSMATAAARERLGLEDANLAEADPGASRHSIVLRPADNRPPHRLGDDGMVLEPNSRLGRLYGRAVAVERYNHRYVLNPALIPGLEGAGVTVPAWAALHGTADAVEIADHPFFIGMQGHPELNSSAGRPHPLLRGFLRAVVRRATDTPLERHSP